MEDLYLYKYPAPPAYLADASARTTLDLGLNIMKIRKESPSDAGAIEVVTVAAFQSVAHSSHTEQLIVRALRDSGQLAVSLVADEDGTVIGHVAVSPVAISGGAEGWYGLGPISVAPKRQGHSVGSQLMGQALTELRRMGAAGCVVLGDPNYYSRFGFKAEQTLVLPDVPAEYFQAVTFNGSVPSGIVSYHESFSATV